MNAFLSPRTVFFGRSEARSEVQAMPPPLPFEEEEVPPVFIQSDIGLQNGASAANDAAVEDAAEPVGASVLSLADNNADEEEDDDDGDIVNDVDPAPVANMGLDDDASPAPAPTAPTTNGKKRGPSLSASGSRNGTPAKTPSRSVVAKTPRTAKSSAASKATPSTTGAKRGRKRKADDGDASSGAAPAAKKARAPRTIREEREPTRAISKRGAAVAAKETFATALKVKITRVEVPVKTAKRRGRKPAAATVKPDQAWEVEEIVDAGVIGPNGKPKTYLVKWKGYPAEENTWEPRKNLSGCPDLLKAFDAKNQPEGAAAGKKAPGRKPGAKAGRKAAAEKPAPAVGPPEKKEPRRPPTERKLAAPKKPTAGTGRRGRPATKK